MKKWIAVVLMATVFALFLSCSDDSNSTEPDKLPTGEISLVDFIPLSVGNWWELKEVNTNDIAKMEILEKVLHDGKDLYIVREPATFAYSIQSNIFYEYKRDSEDMEWNKSPIADGNLSVGDFKEFIVTWTEGESVEYDTLKVERLSNTSITTASGTFECVVFFETSDHSTWYLSKDLGFVRVTDERGDGEMSDYKLINYNLN